MDKVRKAWYQQQDPMFNTQRQHFSKAVALNTNNPLIQPNVVVDDSGDLLEPNRSSWNGSDSKSDADGPEDSLEPLLPGFGGDNTGWRAVGDEFSIRGSSGVYTESATGDKQVQQSMSYSHIPDKPSTKEHMNELKARLQASMKRSTSANTLKDSADVTPEPEARKASNRNLRMLANQQPSSKPSELDLDGLVEQGRAEAEALAQKQQTNPTDAATNKPQAKFDQAMRPQRLSNPSDAHSTLKSSIKDLNQAEVLSQYEQIQKIAAKYRLKYNSKAVQEEANGSAVSQQTQTGQSITSVEKARPESNLQTTPDRMDLDQASFVADVTPQESNLIHTGRAQATIETDGSPPNPIIATMYAPQENLCVDVSQSEMQKAKVNGEYYKDVDEWLEITGFHDETYRNRVIGRQRKTKELKRQLLELELEAQQDSQSGYYALRAQSVHPTQAMKSPSMPPPPNPIAHTAERDSRTVISLENTATSPKKPRILLPSPATSTSSSTFKVTTQALVSKPQTKTVQPAQKAEDGSTVEVDERTRNHVLQNPIPDEHARSVGRPTPHRRRDKRSMSPRGKGTSELPVSGQEYRANSQRASDARNSHNFPFLDDTRPENTMASESGGLANERVDRYRTRDYEERYHKAPQNYRDLKLKSGGVRYFIIKSYSEEIVRKAQDEGVWTTQEHNTDMLADAFKTCRYVILFFSVNNSRGFQGYAYMSSMPGEAPMPRWASSLHWNASPPFHLTWLSTSYFPFFRARHIKNSYNEGHAIGVGRDGQELEETGAQKLCELLDAANGNDDNSW